MPRSPRLTWPNANRSSSGDPLPGHDGAGGTTHDVRAAPTNRASRFAHVDAMRAFAVLLVVLAHAGLGQVVPGGSGVTIFFSISGFIITYVLLRERDRTGGFSAAGFYRRRFLKLAPPFLVVILLPSLIVLALGGNLDPRALLAQTFFAYNWLFLAKLAVLPGSGVVWSLAIEEQFYIAFAIFWLFAVRSRSWVQITIAVASLAVVAATVARLVLATDASNSNLIYYGTHTRLDGIALGILTAFLLRRWSATSVRSAWEKFMGSDWTLVLAVVAYLASLVIRDQFFRDTIRYNLQSIATCAVILWGFAPTGSRLRSAAFRVLEHRVVQVIGLASYSIYLAHLVVITAVAPAMSALPFPVRVVALVVVGLASGLVIYALVELPIQSRASERRLRAQRVADADA